MKKFLGILLAVCLLLGMASIPALAADGFDWQASVTFDLGMKTAEFKYTGPAGSQFVDMFILTSKPSAEGFWDIWNAYSDSTTNGRIKRGGSDTNAASRVVGALGKEDGADEFEFVPGKTYYAYFATPVNGSAWEISKCFEFTYPEKAMYVKCDTEKMTADIFFTPNSNSWWSEMAIFTEPQADFQAGDAGILPRLSNVTPNGRWRIGPSTMTDGEGKIEGTQVLDSHYSFTKGTRYYVYMCYVTPEGGGTWYVWPGYYSFVFGAGAADGDEFDLSQVIMHSDLDNATVTTAAGNGSYNQVGFDTMTGNNGEFRSALAQAVKGMHSSVVLEIKNNGGKAGISFEGNRWNGGGVDPANSNFYFTGEAEGCDGIYLISTNGDVQRASVEYSIYRNQIIIPAGFEGYVSIPVTRIGNSNDESLKGNFDHTGDQYNLYWSPSIFLQSMNDEGASITMKGFGSLFYKAGDADEQAVKELIEELPEGINLSNFEAAADVLAELDELFAANPDLLVIYGEKYQTVLEAYEAFDSFMNDMDEAFSSVANADMDKEHEAAWKKAITDMYALENAAAEDGIDVTGVKAIIDEYAGEFEEAYGYAYDKDNSGNEGDFATFAFALAAAAGSGAMIIRRKRR